MPDGSDNSNNGHTDKKRHELQARTQQDSFGTSSHHPNTSTWNPDHKSIDDGIGGEGPCYSGNFSSDGSASSSTIRNKMEYDFYCESMFVGYGHCLLAGCGFMAYSKTKRQTSLRGSRTTATTVGGSLEGGEFGGGEILGGRNGMRLHAIRGDRMHLSYNGCGG